jgi:hypothetical protein
MKRSTRLLSVAIVLACCALTGLAFAQEDALTGAKPMYVTLPPRYLQNLPSPLTSTVTNWSSSFTTGGKTYNYSMVGTNPQTTNSTTTVTVYIIPVKLIVSGNTYDPASIESNVTSSPIFASGIDFNQGGTDLGKTQYVDAYQRGNFWGYVKTNTSYHVLLNPVVLAEQTFNVPKRDGSIGNPFGFGNVGIVNINWFDAQLQSVISGMTQITPNSFAIALTYNVYLSNTSRVSGCCIGGYHSAFGSTSSPQTYGHFTYIPVVNQFSQDVSALSHEVGEWMDDPFVNNAAPSTGGCGGILENGDPLENNPNFGDYAYSLNGFTYHLQDLVFLDYFSGDNSIPVNGWYSFQHNKTGGQCS